MYIHESGTEEELENLQRVKGGRTESRKGTLIFALGTAVAKAS
jgi:hypothetical protein